MIADEKEVVTGTFVGWLVKVTSGKNEGSNYFLTEDGISTFCRDHRGRMEFYSCFQPYNGEVEEQAGRERNIRLGDPAYKNGGRWVLGRPVEDVHLTLPKHAWGGDGEI